MPDTDSKDLVPQRIRNDTISQVTSVKKISDEIRRRRWNWIVYVLRKERNDDCMVAMEWQPEGKRKVGRPKTTWRRTVKKECCKTKWSLRPFLMSQWNAKKIKLLLQTSGSSHQSILMFLNVPFVNSSKEAASFSDTSLLNRRRLRFLSRWSVHLVYTWYKGSVGYPNNRINDFWEDNLTSRNSLWGRYMPIYLKGQMNQNLIEIFSSAI